LRNRGIRIWRVCFKLSAGLQRGGPASNEEIRGERLSRAEIVAMERTSRERFESFEKNCGKLIFQDRTLPVLDALPTPH
jgi:hypothetical protein